MKTIFLIPIIAAVIYGPSVLCGRAVTNHKRPHSGININRPHVDEGGREKRDLGEDIINALAKFRNEFFGGIAKWGEHIVKNFENKFG